MHFMKDRIKYLKPEKERKKLETCLFMLLGSFEFVAAARGRATTHIEVTTPMRFFANDADLDFSPADTGLVLNALKKITIKAKNNGALFIDLDLGTPEGALQGKAL